MTKPNKVLLIKIIVGILLVVFVYKKCSTDKKSRERLRRTHKVCDSVFVETYLVFGQGAYGLDLVSDWLTDKKHFRMYIGSYDEGDGGFWYHCSGDSIYVRQYIVDDDRAKVNRDSLIISTTLQELKKTNNFEDD